MAIRVQVEDFTVDPKSEGMKKIVAGKETSYQFLNGYYEVPLLFHKYGAYGETGVTEFLVIEDLGCSPSGDWAIGKFTGGTDIHIGFRINMTDLFVSPKGYTHPGVSGVMSPYPDTALVRKNFRLKPHVYVLPGQVWDTVLRFKDVEFAEGNPNKFLKAFVRYTLYDGVDSIIAGKLLEMGVAVTPKNIDWYRRELIKDSQNKVRFEVKMGWTRWIRIPKRLKVRRGAVYNVTIVKEPNKRLRKYEEV